MRNLLDVYLSEFSVDIYKQVRNLNTDKYQKDDIFF